MMMCKSSFDSHQNNPQLVSKLLIERSLPAAFFLAFFWTLLNLSDGLGLSKSFTKGLTVLKAGLLKSLLCWSVYKGYNFLLDNRTLKE